MTGGEMVRGEKRRPLEAPFEAQGKRGKQATLRKAQDKPHSKIKANKEDAGLKPGATKLDAKP